jgi:hypothetical protein
MNATKDLLDSYSLTGYYSQKTHFEKNRFFNKILYCIAFNEKRLKQHCMSTKNMENFIEVPSRQMLKFAIHYMRGVMLASLGLLVAGLSIQYMDPPSLSTLYLRYIAFSASPISDRLRR